MALEPPLKPVAVAAIPPVHAASTEDFAAICRFIEAQAGIFEALDATDVAAEARLMQGQLESGRIDFGYIEQHGTMLSGAALSRYGADAELIGVWTVASARGEGLASAVCRSILERFFTSGGRFVWLSAGDAETRKLYGKLGFREIGTQVNMRVADGR
jgi:predicted GNAT family acetyltransferase